MSRSFKGHHGKFGNCFFLRQILLNFRYCSLSSSLSVFSSVDSLSTFGFPYTRFFIMSSAEGSTAFTN